MHIYKTYVDCQCWGQGKQNSYVGRYLVDSVTRLQLPADLVTLETNY